MIQTTSSPTSGRWRGVRHTVVELMLVVIFGLLYSATFLAGENGLTLSGLNPNNRLQGVEHERLSGILVPVQLGLGLSERAPEIGHLPAWNPYLSTGTPLLNDAFLYLFNPFMSLPVLTLGAVQGTKLALVLGLLLAGVNMWALARAIGLGSLARVTAAGLYMMSGGIVGKIFSGHFQLGLSLAWLPLIFAGLWWTLRSNSRLAPALMAVAFALLYFSGNIYYTLHTLICCAVITAAHLFSRDDEGWHWRGDRLRRVALDGALALGLTMIQFLPVWVVRDFVSHQEAAFDLTTGQFAAQYPLGVSLSNLTLPWETWKLLPEISPTLITAVDYAYIGPAVFLLIAGLVLVGLGQQRKIALIASILAVGMMLWGAGQTALLNDLYRRIPLLAEFRYIGRANAVAGLWWIVLAGVGLDQLWRAVSQSNSVTYDRSRLMRALTVVIVIWAWFLYYSGSGNSTRLSMTLNNFGLFNTLNDLRWSSFHQAADALVGLTVLALVIDSLLIPLDLGLRRRAEFSLRLLRSALSGRLVRIGLLLLALVALIDVLQVNSALVQIGPARNNFGQLYAATFGTGAETDPFPSILEPYSPSAYDAYYSRVRTWGLNEGWSPLPVPGDVIPEGAPKLTYLPQWAIVSSEFQRGGTLDLAREFVERYDGVQVKCVATIPQGGTDPCDIDTNDGSILYRIPQALPYAFVADEDTLRTHADTLTGETVLPVEDVNHQMDTIRLRAAAPEDGQHYTLIVQETNFPGWQAQMDDTPVEVQTITAQMPDGPAAGFIAVPMQPGTHVYTLHFEPPGFAVGAFISLLTVIILLVYVSRLRAAIIRRLRGEVT